MAGLHSLRRISDPVRQYLNDELPARELVKIVDDLVANNVLRELDPDAVAIVDRLHEALALYVPDEVSRREAPEVLIGEPELRERARDFEKQARALLRNE